MLAWPKLLGLGLALFAVGCVLSTAGNLFQMGLFTGSPFVIGVASWAAFGLSCLLLLLSYPLYRGRNWARLTLFGITLFGLVAASWLGVYDVARQHWAVDGVKIPDQEVRSFHRAELISRFISAGSAIILLAPLASLLCLLLHSDVVGAFRKPHIHRDALET